MTKQWCSGCVRFLLTSEFWRNQNWCKSCHRAWRWSNREIEREQDRVRYQRRLQSRGIAGDTGDGRG